MSEPYRIEATGSTAVLDEPSQTRMVDDGEIERFDDDVNCCHPNGSCQACPLVEDSSEADLVEACRRGYHQAQRMVYEQHYDRIMSLMMRMTGDHDEAFDLFHQAFIRVFDRIGDFRGESALGTWIHRVAVNEALQYLRRKKRYQRITEALADDPRRSELVYEDPAIALDVHNALDQLSRRMRRMVLLRYRDGLDYAEIADVLGVKQGTVASGLNRARRQLRRMLQ